MLGKPRNRLKTEDCGSWGQVLRYNNRRRVRTNQLRRTSRIALGPKAWLPLAHASFRIGPSVALQDPTPTTVLAAPAGCTGWSAGRRPSARLALWAAAVVVALPLVSGFG